jgi:hypothetical protein
VSDLDVLKLLVGRGFTPTDALAIQALAKEFEGKWPMEDELTDLAEVHAVSQTRTEIWAVFSPVVPNRMRRMFTARVYDA